MEPKKYDMIMTGWDEVAKVAGQKRTHSPPVDNSHMRGRRVGLEGPKYDQVMTGWDELSPVSGHKQHHSPEPEGTRSKRGRPVKKVDYYRLHHGTAVRPCSDPKTWIEAMSSKEAKNWQQAAVEECHSLKQTGAIEVIPHNQLSKGRKLMKCKWVFKKKFLADVAPTPRAETGRILLALAHRFNWYRKQGDVPSAFLNPDLDVDLYMEMPEGFKKEGHIIRIHKGLYGLKQATALWYDDVKAFLAKQGMFPTITDVCLYTNK